MKLYECLFLSICCNIVGDLQDECSATEKSNKTTPIMTSQDYVFDVRKVHAETTMQSLFEMKAFNVTDYHGIQIKFAVAHHPPYLLLGRTPFSFAIDGVHGSGQAWDILESLSKFFNFRPKIVKSGMSSVGYINKSGHWEGVVGLLSREEADVTLLPVTLTSTRKKDIEFSMPMSTSFYGILVKRPANSSKPDALLRPFTYEVWAWILGSLALMGPLIYLITRTRVRLCKGDPHLTKFFSIHECTWFVFGALMKQGTTLEPISDSSRILFATWWMYIVIVTAFYTANLTAFLTFSGLEFGINDVTSLKSDPEITWLAAYDEALMKLIETHQDMEILREMQKKGRGFFVHNTLEALELVRNGTHVYIDDIRVQEYLIYMDFVKGRQKQHVDKCDFYTTPLEKKYSSGEDLSIQFYWGFGYAKNSSFKDVFDVFFQRLNSYGIISFLHQNYSGSSVCDLPKGYKDRPLENRDLLTTYYLVFFGATLSALAFLFEMFYGKVKQKQKQKENLLRKSWKSSHISFIKPDKNSFLPAPIYHEQFVPYSFNLSRLTENRPKTPLHLQHQETSTKRELQSQARQQYKGKMLSLKKTGGRFKPSQRTGSRTVKDLQKTEMALLVSPFSKEEIQLQDGQGAIVEGSVNGLHVLWNQRKNKLIVKDRKKLEESIVYVDGTPCLYIDCITGSERGVQRIVLNDYIY